MVCDNSLNVNHQERRDLSITINYFYYISDLLVCGLSLVQHLNKVTLQTDVAYVKDKLNVLLPNQMNATWNVGFLLRRRVRMIRSCIPALDFAFAHVRVV